MEKYSCNEKWTHFREPIFNALRIQRSAAVSTAKKMWWPIIIKLLLLHSLQSGGRNAKHTYVAERQYVAFFVTVLINFGTNSALPALQSYWSSQSFGIYLRQRYIFSDYSHKICNLEDPPFWNVTQDMNRQPPRPLRNRKCHSNIHHCFLWNNWWLFLLLPNRLLANDYIPK